MLMWLKSKQSKGNASNVQRRRRDSKERKPLLVNAVSFKSEQVPSRAKTIDKCGEG
jgi:hypothetical protein